MQVETIMIQTKQQKRKMKFFFFLYKREIMFMTLEFGKGFSKIIYE